MVICAEGCLALLFREDYKNGVAYKEDARLTELMFERQVYPSHMLASCKVLFEKEMCRWEARFSSAENRNSLAQLRLPFPKDLGD